MLRQFTATVYILDAGKVLLHWHHKHHRFLPPGGHLEEGETPPECAKREALEETGLEIALICDEHLHIDESHAVSLERPFLCLLENIPAHQDQKAHQHIDFIYLGKPIGGTLDPEAVRSTQLRWMRLEEVLSLKEEEIFSDTKKILQQILKSHNFQKTH
ncbi:MAG: NUDIX domain-containing protein [Chlamydiales bacterium]|nr:NUDIX domain-containing protein [Chlamydiales bacterium]